MTPAAFDIPTKEARARLEAEWTAIAESGGNAVDLGLPVEVQQAIGRAINSKTKTYRYVLPTQVLAKLCQSRIDCRAVQEGSPLPGAFDARSFC